MCPFPAAATKRYHGGEKSVFPAWNIIQMSEVILHVRHRETNVR